ncbi:hypothetical protein RUND412_010795, partial [Rhizina undulata]
PYRMKQAASHVQGGGASGMSSLILFSSPSIAKTDSTDSGAEPIDSLSVGFNGPGLIITASPPALPIQSTWFIAGAAATCPICLFVHLQRLDVTLTAAIVNACRTEKWK